MRTKKEICEDISKFIRDNDVANVLKESKKSDSDTNTEKKELLYK